MNIINIDLIEEYIKSNEMTRIEFCKKCKISYETFLKVIRNDPTYRLSVVFKIARGMGLNHVVELFSDEKPKKKE